MYLEFLTNDNLSSINGIITTIIIMMTNITSEVLGRAADISHVLGKIKDK